METQEFAEPEHAAMNLKQTINATRRVHADFHESLGLDLNDLGFGLDIPSNECAEFKTSIFEVKWIIKLSFLILSPNIQNVSPRTSLSPSRPSSSSRLNSPAPTPTLQPMPRTPFTSTSLSSLTSPQVGLLADGSQVKHVPHLIPIEYGSQSLTAQERLGAGDGRGKEELIQCQIPIKILPNSTDYQPQACTIDV